MQIKNELTAASLQSKLDRFWEVSGEKIKLINKEYDNSKGDERIHYNFANFNLKLLLTTDIELNAIAAPAIIGFNKNPLTGYNTPAAIGIPIRL